MDKIDILILNKNYEQYLSDALNSCTQQTYKNIDIIIADDNSKDNSRNIILEYAKKYDNIKYKFLNEDCGISKIRNILISMSTSNYLSFLSSDDFYHPNFINEAYTALKITNKNIGGVYGNFHKINYKKDIIGKVMAKDIPYDKKKWYSANGGITVTFESALFKKSIFNSNVLFREEIYIGEESLFIGEILKLGFDFNIFCKNNYLAYKRYHNTSGHNIPKNQWEEQRIKRIQIYRGEL